MSSAAAMSNNANHLKTQPPDLIVHSTTGNWQEHSFDSSIVTEGHYDASFESEVMGPIPNTTATATTAAVTVTQDSSGKQSRPRPPPLAHSAKKSVFSVSGLG